MQKPSNDKHTAIFKFCFGNIQNILQLTCDYLQEKKEALNKKHSRYITFINELTLMLEKMALGIFIVWLAVLIYQSATSPATPGSMLQVQLLHTAILLLMLSFFAKVIKLFRFLNWSVIQFLYPIFAAIVLTLFFIPEASSEAMAILRNIFPPDVHVMDFSIAENFLEYRIIAAKWLAGLGYILTFMCLIYAFLLFREKNITPAEKPQSFRKNFVNSLKAVGYLGAAGLIILYAFSLSNFYYMQTYTVRPDPDLSKNLVFLEYTPNVPVLSTREGQVPVRIYCDQPVPLVSYIYHLDNGLYSVATFTSNGVNFQEMRCPSFKSESDLKKALASAYILANFGAGS